MPPPIPPPLLFATNANINDRFDLRWVGQNINDDGTSATIANLLDLTTPNPAAVRLQILLGDASEILMSAASVSARYSVNDLLQYGGQLLVNITCGLCFGIIMKRRGRPVTTSKMISDAANEAQAYIEQLRRGDRIFSMVPSVPQAGLPGTACMSPIIPFGGPDIVQISGRYFGVPVPTCCPGGGGNPYAPWPPPSGPC